jgi:hypothetical protein
MLFGLLSPAALLDKVVAPAAFKFSTLSGWSLCTLVGVGNKPNSVPAVRSVDGTSWK